LRDFLLQLATANLFRAQWTDQIHEEWIRNLLEDRPTLDMLAIDRTRKLMDSAVDDPLVKGYEHLIPSIALPDAGDRHVVAAAIHAKVDAIVTSNLKDFPASSLANFNLEAIHPDDFISAQYDLTEAAVIAAASRCCRRLTNPRKCGKDYLDTLLKQGLPKTVDLLRPYEEIICPSVPAK
jgi:hypothetical protein